jgi:hypothetical protein
MQKRLLLSCVVSTFVVTLSGMAVGHNNHSVLAQTGPVTEDAYDVVQDILLAEPSGSPPVKSFLRDHHTLELAADLSAFSNLPPSPCDGLAQAWNATLATHPLGGEERRRFLGILLQVMAENACAAQVVRDEAGPPPFRIVSIQPIPSAT